MRSPKLIFTLLFLAWPASALAQSGAPRVSTAKATPLSAHLPAFPLAKPVVRINGSVLTDRDLLREMLAIFPYARQHNGTFPKAMEADIRRGALKMIEFEELVYQEAIRRHMTVAPERLDNAEKQFRTQFDDQQQFQQYLRIECNGSLKVLKNKIRRSLLIEGLLRAEVTDKSVVTLAEAKTFYDKNPGRFDRPETYTLQSITILPPKSPTPDQLKQVKLRAENALSQVKAAKDYEEFGSLAERISEDDYRVMMGDHKAVDVAQLPTPVLQTALHMQPGEISGLIQVDQAFTIIRMNAHDPAHRQKFSEVKDSLRQDLQRKKVDLLRAQFDARLRKTAKIEEL